MKIECIANGRFPEPTIWIDHLKEDARVVYPDSMAFSLTTAVEIYNQLAQAIAKASKEV